MARAIASDPVASLAFVVDDDAHLLGMVRRRDLDVQLLARALPRIAARRMGETDQRAAFGWAKGTGLQAADIMSHVEPAATEESFSVAIERALDADLDAMPVIDKSGRLLGYLSVFEVLVASLDGE
jgi:CBS-domain-containing membrane protein